MYSSGSHNPQGQPKHHSSYRAVFVMQTVAYRTDHKKPSEAILMHSAGYSGNFFGNGNGSGNGKYLIVFSHGSSVAFVML